MSESYDYDLEHENKRATIVERIREAILYKGAPAPVDETELAFLDAKKALKRAKNQYLVELKKIADETQDFEDFKRFITFKYDSMEVDIDYRTSNEDVITFDYIPENDNDSLHEFCDWMYDNHPNFYPMSTICKGNRLLFPFMRQDDWFAEQGRDPDTRYGF